MSKLDNMKPNAHSKSTIWDEIDKDWNGGNTNTTNIKKKPIYDGVYDDNDGDIK